MPPYTYGVTPDPVDLLLVRATVNLVDLPVGSTAFVDPTLPYIKECLEGNVLVPVEQEPEKP